MVYVCCVSYFDQTWLKGVFDTEEAAIQWCDAYNRHAKEQGWQIVDAWYMELPLNEYPTFE